MSQSIIPNEASVYNIGSVLLPINNLFAEAVKLSPTTIITGAVIQSRSITLTEDLAFKPITNTWTISSDKRIKENIKDANLNICYDDIRKVQLRRYNFISSFSEIIKVNDKTRLGFIAQEVQMISPKMVETIQFMGFDDFHTLNLDQLNFAHFGATKRVIEILEEQKSTIYGQQLRISDLEFKFESTVTFILELITPRIT